MATSNTPWQNLAGHNFDGRYPLHAYLYSEGQGATYQTEAGPDRLPATIRFVPGGPQDAAAYLESWSTAASLNHPNLLAVYDYGHGVLDDAPVVYVVSAAPDNRLADVLSERALNEEETLEVATAVVEALVYLHAKGLAQGSLDPSHVFAVDDKVKIASDHIRLNASPAGDMESFGLLLAQCLTGQDAGRSRVPNFTPLAPLPQDYRECNQHPTLREMDSGPGSFRAAGRARARAGSGSGKQPGGARPEIRLCRHSRGGGDSAHRRWPVPREFEKRGPRTRDGSRPRPRSGAGGPEAVRRPACGRAGQDNSGASGCL
jgi:Protein kinase domain.